MPSRVATRVDRPVQVAPCLGLDARRDLGADSAGERSLLDGDERARPAERLEHRLEVEREDAAERDHLGEDLVLEDQLGRGVERDREHSAVRDDRRVAARPKPLPEKVSAG